MSNPRILIVDDDLEIRDLVQDLLERNHMVAVTAESAAHADKLLEDERFDLIVLDVMMPGEDGTTFCHRVRQTSQIPILMISVLGTDVDRILGMELGADDYLAKPFNPRELIVRIKAILRRAPPMKPGETRRKATYYEFLDYRLTPETRSVTQNDVPIDLTSGEFSVLLALVEQAPRILSRDQLLEFSRGAASNPFDRSIDTHISRLRQKLRQAPGETALIKTVRNIGYAFAATVKKTVQ